MATPPFKVSSQNGGIKFAYKAIKTDRPQQVLKRLGKQAPQQLAQALYDEALALMDNSKEIVPTSTQDVNKSQNERLYGSAFVDGPNVRPQPNAVVGYDKEYAVYVHQRTELRHNISLFSGKQTQAKFLEDPFNQARRGMRKRLASTLELWLAFAGD